MLTKVRALVAINDGGHRLLPGDVDRVLSSFARLWISLGWAEEVKPGRPRKDAAGD